MSIKNAFEGIFDGIHVLVTGHTGFKGSWLTLWLQELGAHVIGYSLPPPTHPSNFDISHISEGMTSLIGDIRDYNKLKETFNKYQPLLVFHLAAQPIVLHAFESPKETFDCNAGGTINVLEAARGCPSVKALVMITSDKCYENQEWIWGYRENDNLGGYDPYSASKSMAEHAIASYRKSFFIQGNHTPAVASARAGNVIGGGDFSDFRIVPDCMKALMERTPVRVRNPQSVRPWLNVLDPLSGYLWLAAKLLLDGKKFADAWNFGPLEQEAVTVLALVEKAIALWGDGDWINTGSPDAKPEMGMLRLNWDKAANNLKWRPTYNWIEALEQTVDWFQAFDRYRRTPQTVDMREICVQHIQLYTEKARLLNLPWTINKNLCHVQQ
jgi:CDP-glucose 4,6-dehydratase